MPYFTIFAKGEEKTRVTYGRTGQEGSSVKLMPGSYVAEVTNDKDAARPMVKVEDIEIMAPRPWRRPLSSPEGSLPSKPLGTVSPWMPFQLFVKAAEEEKPSSVTYGRTGQNGFSRIFRPVFYDGGSDQR